MPINGVISVVTEAGQHSTIPIYLSGFLCPFPLYCLFTFVMRIVIATVFSLFGFLVFFFLLRLTLNLGFCWSWRFIFFSFWGWGGFFGSDSCWQVSVAKTKVKTSVWGDFFLFFFWPNVNRYPRDTQILQMPTKWDRLFLVPYNLYSNKLRGGARKVRSCPQNHKSDISVSPSATRSVYLKC